MFSFNFTNVMLAYRWNNSDVDMTGELRGYFDSIRFGRHVYRRIAYKTEVLWTPLLIRNSRRFPLNACNNKCQKLKLSSVTRLFRPDVFLKSFDLDVEIRRGQSSKTESGRRFSTAFSIFHGLLGGVGTMILWCVGSPRRV